MATPQGAKIQWADEKRAGKFVCYLPLTLDGVGKTADKALKNLEAQAARVVKALKASGVKVGFSEMAVHKAVEQATWWYKDGACKKWKKDKEA